MADATRRLLALNLPPDVRDSVRRLLGSACLGNADYNLLENDINTACAGIANRFAVPALAPLAVRQKVRDAAAEASILDMADRTGHSASSRASTLQIAAGAAAAVGA